MREYNKWCGIPCDRLLPHVGEPVLVYVEKTGAWHPARLVDNTDDRTNWYRRDPEDTIWELLSPIGGGKIVVRADYWMFMPEAPGEDRQ